MNPGHALTWTKGNEARGIPPKPILPTAHETAILRRVAQGYLIVTFVDGEACYSYEDGTAAAMTERQFQKMVRNRWLIPDRGDTLFEEGPAQVYRARKP